jgi:DNA uptake protein ComE-like DNA-binding protein
MILAVRIIGNQLRAHAARFAVLLGLVFLVFFVPAGSAKSGLIDINHATVSELKTLPGIRDAYAAAIVTNRPYKNKAQLLSKHVIPEAAYGKIKNKIIARQ